MIIKDLLTVACGKIAIYEAVDNTPDTDYSNLYVGCVSEVPQEFFNRKIPMLFTAITLGLLMCR